MAWPMSQDYNETIQNPAHCFADPELQRGETVVSALGLPIPCSGNFADVYAIVSGPNKWAVKCFTREIPGLKERYAAVSQYLQQVQLPFMVDFRFLDQGIRVRNQWYPILKMQWVEGLALNTFVRENLDKPLVMEALCHIWHRMAVRMREANLGHCDLQHGNVLMVQGAVAGRFGVRLVDYDGMCVPALELLKTIEVGHPSYQHPQRLRDRLYGIDVDRFSNLVIYTALRALKVGGKSLWDKYDNGDNLLFRQADFAAPQTAAVFQDLLRSNDPDVPKLAKAVAQASQNPMDRVPLLEQLVGKPPAIPGVGSFPGTAKPTAEQPPRLGTGSHPGTAKPAAVLVPKPGTGSHPGAARTPAVAPVPAEPKAEVLLMQKRRAAIIGVAAGVFGIAVAAVGAAMLLGPGGKDKAKLSTKKKDPPPSSPLAKVVETKPIPSKKSRPGKTALIVQCGKGKGNKQGDLRTPGYDCRLIQGFPFDGWPGSALKTHCWTDNKEVRFEVIVPPGKEGVLNLWLVDGDNQGRKERVSVQGRPVGDYSGFGPLGVEVTAPISAEEAKSGKIDVTVTNLGPGTAVVSTVAFTPQAVPPKR